MPVDMATGKAQQTQPRALTLFLVVVLPGLAIVGLAALRLALRACAERSLSLPRSLRGRSRTGPMPMKLLGGGERGQGMWCHFPPCCVALMTERTSTLVLDRMGGVATKGRAGRGWLEHPPTEASSERGLVHCLPVPAWQPAAGSPRSETTDASLLSKEKALERGRQTRSVARDSAQSCCFHI